MAQVAESIKSEKQFGHCSSRRAPKDTEKLTSGISGPAFYRLSIIFSTSKTSKH